VVEATPLLDETLFQVVDVANPILYGRRVAGARITPSPRDLGQGYRAATATVRWNLVYCSTKTPRCHQLSVLLESEEVSCYGTIIGIYHIGNFCFWVPFCKQVLLRNCPVYFVEIRNLYVGRMIIKAAKRILILTRHVIWILASLFLEHSVYRH